MISFIAHINPSARTRPVQPALIDGYSLRSFTRLISSVIINPAIQLCAMANFMKPSLAYKHEPCLQLENTSTVQFNPPISVCFFCAQRESSWLVL